MIVVIADDFSGAAEIAGIGRACGLDTLLVNDLPATRLPQLLVIDSATRSLTEAEATEKLRIVCQKIDQLKISHFRLFKKVDSLLRGHIRAEIGEIKKHFNIKRSILLSANPSRERTIQDGFIKIGEEFLHQTPLASDPEFPRVSSHVSDLLFPKGNAEAHQHLFSQTPLDDQPGLFTADVRTRNDLEYYVKEPDGDLLLAGGAEFFEIFLISEGHVRTSLPESHFFRGANLFINGSTYVQQSFNELFPDIPAYHLLAQGSSPFSDSTVIDQIEVVNLDLNTRRSALLALAPAREIKEGQACKALLFLAEFVRRVMVNQQDRNLNLFITGGSTASFLFQHLAIHQFIITSELSEGVVLLQPTDYPHLQVVVKPGSYAWPATLKLTITPQEL